MLHRLNTPVKREELAPLRAGDTVLLSGTVYTARDAAHLRMMEALDAGQPLPFPVEGSALYYVGPTPTPSTPRWRPGCWRRSTRWASAPRASAAKPPVSVWPSNRHPPM